jgi:hypothetical protein
VISNDGLVSISPSEARHVLWHFRQPGGLEPGSFTQALIAAMAAADPRNLALLRLGFPGYADAVKVAMGSAQGIAGLQRAAGVTLCDRCKGSGYVPLEVPVLVNGSVRHLDTCPDCRGRGAR